MLRGERPLMALLSAAALSGASDALADYTVESSAFESPEAAGDAAAALPVSVGAVVVRRYLRGSGWTYYLRVDAVDALDDASRLAREIAVVTGGASVFEQPGRVEVGRAEPPPEAKVPPAAPEPEKVPRAGSDHVLRAAIKAHEVRAKAAKSLEQEPLRFVFERRVHAPTSLVVAHAYERRGGARRLQVEVRSGTGADSVTLIDGKGHAVLRSGGTSVDRDPVRIAEVVERFSPEQILSTALNLSADMERSDAWQALMPVEGEHRLVADRHAVDTDILEAVFDASSGRLSEITWRTDHGDVRYAFSDYREPVKGLWVPFQTRVLRSDVLIEEVLVHALELPAALSSDRFSLASADPPLPAPASTDP